MSRYLVKNKYTYERVPQTDYSYRPDYLPYSWTQEYTLSHNYILPIFRTEEIGETKTLAFSADQPAVLDGASAMLKALPQASGFRVKVTNAADEEGLAFRVTFFGEDGKSFSSVGDAKAAMGENGLTFSIARMDFVPEKAVLETTNGQVTAGITPVAVWNTLGEWGGQAHFYTAENAVLTDRGSSLVLTLNGKGGFGAGELPVFRGTPYSMLMPRRNTLFVILRNPDAIPALTLSFTTAASPDFCPGNAVTLPLEATDRPRAYYFNLSACPGCNGWLSGFRFEAEGIGELVIDGYSFEQEKPIESPTVRVISCIADPGAQTVTLTGSVLDPAALAPYAGGRISLYAGTMADAQGLGCKRESPAGKMRVSSFPLPADGDFTLTGIPLSDGTITLLPYQLLLFAEADGMTPLCLCGRFYVENYNDFAENPYRFELPGYTVNVLDCGAFGDAIHNDTDAIQSAIDRVNAAGGGRVLIPGGEGIYGRRYIVTSLLLRSCVELHLGDGAVLWQSQRRDDYPYEPAIGHDGVIPGINWTHSLHVSNLPLVQGANLHHIKITGKGSLRMLDTASVEGVDMPGYAAGCPRRIHCIPLGLFKCEDVETSDFEIIRSNNYHTEYNHCERVYIANMRCHEVKCVSGDGYGMAGGKHILVNRCFLQSNDDGIVMSTHMYDPRGLLWWTNAVGEDNSCRDVTVVHSYINSGGGKALAFITWGTSDPVQEKEEISGVTAYDNYLTCVNPVGTWPDNPYAGKQPFDNSETDDYSPVKDVRIWSNRYVGNCTLGPIHATNLMTDCGVKSTAQFRNGGFTLGGMANWTLWPNAAPDSVQTAVYADKEKGYLSRFECGTAACAQGLHLEAGRHTFSCELLTGRDGAELFVTRIPALGTADAHDMGELLLSKVFTCPRPTTVSLVFDFDSLGIEEDEADLFLGVRSVGCDPEGYAVFDRCTLSSEVDRDALAARRAARFIDAMRADFELTDAFSVQPENGKLYLHAAAPLGSPVELYVRGERETFAIECAVRANDYDRTDSANGFGYRFAVRDGGRSYRELRFIESTRSLTVTDVTDGRETLLYTRDNFFFTSTDFHIFRLEVGRDTVSLWIDGSQYAVIPCPAASGRVCLVLRDVDASVCNLTI